MGKRDLSWSREKTKHKAQIQTREMGKENEQKKGGGGASVWQSRVQGTPVRNPTRTEYVIWVFPRNNATWCFLDWILDDPVKISCACGGLKTRVLELTSFLIIFTCAYRVYDVYGIVYGMVLVHAC
uniref:Uncharacterized protein n=1 Tax=Cacopsylla melanoneura TaxID=428564 RepID=A0A8D8PX61_9HEMI